MARSEEANEKLEEAFTRHMQRALKVLAALEMEEDAPMARQAIVEACMSVSDETIRGVLVGQLALAKLDILAEEVGDPDDDEGDGDDPDDEGDGDFDED